MQSNQNAVNIDGRYRMMLILWVAMLTNIGFFFVVSLFLGPEAGTVAPPSSLFIAVVTVLGTFMVIISFAVKRKFFARSVEKQDVGLVQKGLVIACGMCEVSALLGLLLRLLVVQREYYLLFLVAVIGTALHFPRREQLLSATYKTSLGGAT